MKSNFAQAITNAMATWLFIGIFLAFCITEIILNHVGVFHFDPTTFILNLFLSLVAAIQGSIIMIAQKQLDARADQRAQETHDAVIEELQEIKQIHKDLTDMVKKNQ